MPPSPTAPRWLSDRTTTTALAVITALSLGLSACSSEQDQNSTNTGRDSQPVTDGQGSEEPTENGQPEDENPGISQEAGNLESYYDQDLAWSECEQTTDFECSMVQVPLDYDHPEEASIQIAVTRPAGTAADQPSLLVNPGGPGASGVDFVQQDPETLFSQDLLEAFSITGFDPRGVGDSSAVECFDDAGTDELRAVDEGDLSGDEGLAQVREQAEEYASVCDENSGELLDHIDTDSAAQDMDILRAVLADEKLSYLGYSYGTALGASYAEQFPDRVGAMVLDGALDPAVGTDEITLAQAEGFEQALHAWATWCTETPDQCQLEGSTTQIVETVRDLLADVAETTPTAADGRDVPIGTFVSGLIVPLYSEASWPLLGQGVTEAIDGDPSLVQSWADITADRAPDGTYTTNSFDAFNAINCADHPVDADQQHMDAHAEQLAQVSPTFGPHMSHGAIACDVWPIETPEPGREVSATGADPIVVVGTTGDPATPYQWSEALASQLDSGVLVTHQGEGHGAYVPGNDCIIEVVDDYLIHGTVPEDGTTCPNA
ncbi:MULTISPECIES: alpha/beta hydrolase [Auritidibacter]|uniref:alpha/beta hydrolase n=1 Tax=Auritidibacter TaxID=1160973 RepID=UPI000D7290F4|nr:MULTISPECIES: alpha/beta hydrolase [Auritidibacter]PXA79902.1 alpha/beta hydrolase [Auritidibacter sp. NML120636]PXA81605.1 alpha/beta hydrolase [Auritidibacter sp. NML120779]WGH86065.1 alpha/beta hydrolase [Auritidibacter ignavus]WGH88350.1 alpha/beta hydrolase [Auritidibacter ignavus]